MDVWVVYVETESYEYFSLEVIAVTSTLEAAKAVVARREWRMGYVERLASWAKREHLQRTEKGRLRHASERPLPPAPIVWSQDYRPEAPVLEQWDGAPKREPSMPWWGYDYSIRRYAVETDETLPVEVTV